MSRDKSFALVSLAPRLDLDGLEAGTAWAQVPFDFLVGEMVLPAGEYAVEASSLQGMLSMRRADSNSGEVLVQGINFNRHSQVLPNKLLFYYEQDSYFLAQALRH